MAERRNNMKAKNRILAIQLFVIGIVCCCMSGTTVIQASTEDNPNTRTIERRAGESEAAYQARRPALALAPQRKQRAESRLNQQAGESDTDYLARLRMTIKATLSLNGPLGEKREGESEDTYKARCRAVNRMLWIRDSPLIAQAGENEEDYQDRIHASKVAADRRKHSKPPIKRAGQSEAAYQAALRAYRAKHARIPTNHVSRTLPIIAQAGENEEDYQDRIRASKVATNRRKHSKPPIKRAGQSEPAYQAALRAYRARQARSSIKHVLLTAKPLPELKDLKIELPPDATTDTMVLFCFLDMQQRRSRKCALRLTKRAQALKRKGVTVCIVQASAIDQKTFDEWVNKNSIPFPTGMIRGDDAEEVLRKWGIQSMPWLILTVRSNVVSAEGIRLAELSDKLGQIRKNKTDSTKN
jgi:hypothetical protein